MDSSDDLVVGDVALHFRDSDCLGSFCPGGLDKVLPEVAIGRGFPIGFDFSVAADFVQEHVSFVFEGFSNNLRD